MALIETTARRLKRGLFRRETRSPITVLGIVRTAPNEWTAAILYTPGLGTWEERVVFARSRKEEHDVITVTDADFPGDRKRAFIAAKGADMHSIIIEYVISGRW